MSLIKRTKVMWALALVIATTLALVAPHLPTADPQPVQAQGGSGPDYVSDPVTPLAFNGSLASLPAPSNVGPEREIARLITHQGRAETTAAARLDPLLTAEVLPIALALGAPTRNFDGIPYQSVNPSDPNGDVGPNHFIEVSNSIPGTTIHIYDKAAPNPTLLVNTTIQAIWTNAGGVGDCTTLNHGDPVVLWDSLADRWFISEFADTTTAEFCILVSQGPDPVNDGWYLYNFLGSSVNGYDYPKYGVWPDGYYATINNGQQGMFVYDRVNMLAGNAATLQYFTGAGALDGFGFQALTPADLDGTTAPPANSPGIFMRHVDADAHPTYSGGGSDFVEMYFLDVDWTTPANSSLTGPTVINVSEFDSDLCGLLSFSCFPQPGTGTQLDPLREVIMHRLAYRNFGTHESLVGNFVTDLDGSDSGGIRWFELRNTGGGWFLQDEGTYAGDGAGWDGIHRWMGAIAQDGQGNIALGYSVSNSSSVFPGLRYTGRLATDPAGTMPQGEQIVVNGTEFNSSNRWGDYFSMSIDPTDDCTFWFVGMYGGPTNDWHTRVASFAYSECLGAATADLAITKTDGLTTANPGDNTTYTIVVTNNGPDDVVAAPVVDTFPVEFTGATWTCAITGTGSCADAGPTAGNINTTVDLTSGSSATFTVTGTIDAGVAAPYTLSNTATVNVPTGVTDPTPGNNTATDDTDVVAALLPDLEMLITADDTTVDVGQLVTFTVSVQNIGTDDILQGLISNTVQLDPDLTYVGDTCGAAVLGQQLDWMITPPMFAGDPAVTCTITVTVNPGTEGQTLTSFASVAFDGQELDLVNNDDLVNLTVNVPGGGDDDDAGDDDGGTTPTGGASGTTGATAGSEAPTTLPSTGYPPSESEDSSSTTSTILMVIAGVLALSIVATSALVLRRKQH